MRELIRIVALSALALFFTAAAGAQQAGRLDVGALQNSIEAFVPEMKARVSPVLTPEERRIMDSVAVEIPADENAFSVAAEDEAGERKIFISPGIVAFLGFLSDAMLIDNMLGFKGCLDDYLTYFLKRLFENSERAKWKKPLVLIQPPYVFGLEGGNGCTGFTPKAADDNPRFVRVRENILNNSVYLMFLHELAHHVYGVARMRDAPLAERRKLELEADVWAVKKMALSGVSPLTAMPFWLFAMAVNGGSPEQEAASTHPLGTRRFLMVVKDALLHDKALLRYLERTGRKEAFLEEMRRLEEVHKALPE